MTGTSPGSSRSTSASKASTSSSRTTAQAAVQLAHEHLPDLVLLDLMMPKIDGVEVCRRLRANLATASMPVARGTIAITARSSRSPLEMKKVAKRTPGSFIAVDQRGSREA